MSSSMEQMLTIRVKVCNATTNEGGDVSDSCVSELGRAHLHEENLEALRGERQIHRSKITISPKYDNVSMI